MKIEKKYTLKSHLTQEEIYDRLTYPTGYEVSVRENIFNLKRIINYRNSFLPQIKVTLSNEIPSQIDVIMKLHRFVLVFMVIWLSFVTFFCIITMINFSFENLDKFQIIPFLMFGFGLVMPYVSFKIEANKSKSDLLRLLEADII